MDGIFFWNFKEILTEIFVAGNVDGLPVLHGLK